MIINGTSYPETVMTQLIGEQTLTIDNLRWQIKCKDTFNSEMAGRIVELTEELDKLKARIEILVEKIDG
jgi:hypothetical protein